MSDLICLGEPLIEYNHRPDGSIDVGYGGDVSNCAIAAARLGARVSMLCSLGRDEGGSGLLELWSREGVSVNSVTHHPTAPTGAYHIHHESSGHRFEYERKGSAASLMKASDLDKNAIKDAQILHASGISQAISDVAAECVFDAVKFARQSGTRVSYDTNLRLNLWDIETARDTIHAAVSMADIVLPGLDDARALTQLHEPDEIIDFYLGLGPEIVALTMGEKGVRVATSTRRETYAPLNVDAVDATGAGDAFDGAFLACLLREMDPFEAARFANVAAALSTRSYGAINGLANWQEVTDTLAS